MANNTLKVRHKQRYDTEANWKSKDPILLAGEMAISSDKNGRFKVGDGKNKWSALTYSKADLSKSDVTTALGYTPPTTNTTYSIGNASTAGIGKLYTATGTATDGSMTQAAITSALAGKATNHSHPYLPLSGGTMTGTIKKVTKGGGWKDGRDNATIINNGTIATGAFYPTISQKSKTGSWDVGVLDDTFYFSWASDTNYNAGTNDSKRISIDTSGNITANATSASKLKTARTVSSASNEFNMSFSYDGSADSTASLGYYYATGFVGNKSNYPYHRIAKIDTITGQYVDKAAIFLITQDYYGGGYGICRVTLRTNSSSQVSQANVTWLVRSGFSASDLQIGLYNTAGATYADLFLRIPGTYGSIVVRCLSTGTRGSITRTWSLINSQEVDNTTTTDALKSFEVYTSVSAAATALHSKAYTNILSATDDTIVAYSSKLGTVNVGSATQPIYLEAGTPKTCTYTLGCSVPSGAKFTDTNTWRGIQNNLTSDSTTDSLSAAQGKALKALVDGKAASSHSHNYAGASSAGGAATNALALNGVALANKSAVFGKVPYIGTDGVIELGRYIDFHYGNSEDKDYTARITPVDGNGALNIIPARSSTEILRLSSNGQTSVLGFYGSIGAEGFLGFNNTNKLVRIDATFKKEYRIHDTGSITYGTAAPTAAATAGDIYIQIT